MSRGVGGLCGRGEGSEEALLKFSHGGLADKASAYHSEFVHHKGSRQAHNAILFCGPALLVHQHSITQRCPLREGFNFAMGLAGVNGENNKAFVHMLLVQGFQLLHCRLADGAFFGPKAYKHHFVSHVLGEA